MIHSLTPQSFVRSSDIHRTALQTRNPTKHPLWRHELNIRPAGLGSSGFSIRFFLARHRRTGILEELLCLLEGPMMLHEEVYLVCLNEIEMGQVRKAQSRCAPQRAKRQETAGLTMLRLCCRIQLQTHHACQAHSL